MPSAIPWLLLNIYRKLAKVKTDDNDCRKCTVCELTVHILHTYSYFAAVSQQPFSVTVTLVTVPYNTGLQL